MAQRCSGVTSNIARMPTTARNRVAGEVARTRRSTCIPPLYTRAHLPAYGGYATGRAQPANRESLRDAQRVLLHAKSDLYDPDVIYVGGGEDRDAYRIGEVVYKLNYERHTANRHDHDTQVEARQRGYAWAAPSSTLYCPHDQYGTEDVLAMPYLTDDGSDADPEARAAMHAQAGLVDRLGGNYVVINRQPIVIDYCTVVLD